MVRTNQKVVGQTSSLPVTGTSGSAIQQHDGPQSGPEPSGRRPDPPRHLISGLHSRGALPHLKREGAAYFVTFRLADTLPRTVLIQLKEERERILRAAQIVNRPLTWNEQKEMFAWYSERVDKYLDTGLGECWLRDPGVAELVCGALRHFEDQHYTLHAWVIMPNHVHVVVRPNPLHSLSTILKSWKSYTAVHANRLLNRQGEPFWQSESYDHCCRDQEDLAQCSSYTTLNPVKAGLCASPEHWLWSSACVGQTSGLPVTGTSGSAIQQHDGPQSSPEPSGQRPDPRREPPRTSNIMPSSDHTFKNQEP